MASAFIELDSSRRRYPSPAIISILSVLQGGGERKQLTASSSAGNRASWKTSSVSLSLSFSAEADLSGFFSGLFELAV